MRYSICDFSQVEITKFNRCHPDNTIDPTDLFIFMWFKGFALKTVGKNKDGTARKGMWSQVIDGATYYCVRYDAIIKDFPILNYQSVKSIQRRFDKYVAAGILVKKVIHCGKKGNFTYFGFTDLFFSFEYDSNNPEQKTELSGKTKAVGEDNSVQTKAVAEDKPVQTKTVGEDKPVQTKAVGEDKPVQTKAVGEDNSVQTLIYNSPINLKNSSANSSAASIGSGTTQQAATAESEKAGEVVFTESLTDLFGYDPKFCPNPYPDLIRNMADCSVPSGYMSEYLRWVFAWLKPSCRNKDNFANYFFKSFTKPSCISRFRFEKQQEIKGAAEKKARQIPCPVCGAIHDKSDAACPECNFAREYLDDRQTVIREKAVYNLRKNDTARYQNYLSALNRLSDEYPISLQFRQEAKRIEFRHKQAELEKEYLKLQVPV